MWSLEERRGHLKAILWPSSCVKDWKTKRQTRNKYRMHVFFKKFLFSHSFYSSLFVFHLGVCTDRGGGFQAKSGLAWTGGERGVKTGKNLQTSYMDGPYSHNQGWRQEFSDGGLTLPTRGQKYGFQDTINAKNLRKNCASPSDGGLACADGGYSPLALPWRHPWP